MLPVERTFSSLPKWSNMGIKVTVNIKFQVEKIIVLREERGNKHLIYANERRINPDTI